jgi:hypothetical protein
MPDHLHLLINPSQETSIVDFVRDFKGRSTRLAWQHGHRGKIWQARFYDHFLRKDEDIETVVHYILNNPVRAEIVSDWRAYPFCGSRWYCRCTGGRGQAPALRSSERQGQAPAYDPQSDFALYDNTAQHGTPGKDV